MSFESLGLLPELLKAVADAGYSEPTPIQSQAIPVILAGQDVMGAAQTGTGKTAGFTLPLLHRLARHANTSVSPARHPVRALILTPTRELGVQVFESVRTYGKHLPLRAMVAYGGVPIEPQMEELRKGVEVLVATPGRLLDHVERRTVTFTNVEVLVLDEADRMLDMGFMPDIKRIIGLLPAKRQNLLFSATFSEEIRRLADGLLNQPVLVEVARRNTTAETVTHIVHPVADEDKRALLAHLIRSRDLTQVLVFVGTKQMCGRLARLLDKEGIAADSIHGDKSQQQREDALAGFKEGRVRVLVATDVAARGLDIEDLPHVVNFELPHTPEDYVHRIGRTGRAGKEGEAVSLVSPHEAQRLVDIEKLIKREIPQQRVSGFDPGEDWEYPPTGRRRPAGRGGRSAAAAPSRAPAASPRERGEARRSEPRGEGHARPPRAASRAPVAADGFDFSKPYEPANPPPQPAEQALPQPSLTGRPLRPGHRPRPVAALLGGLPRRQPEAATPPQAAGEPSVTPKPPATDEPS